MPPVKPGVPESEVRLRRLSRRRLVDDAADALRRAVLEGVFKPGERLPEDRLARELGISRTPLREAFRMLEEEGLVSVSPGRGVEVVRIDIDEAKDLYDVREVLDGLAARRAAARITPERIAALAALLEEMRRCLERGGFHDWLNCNIRFHEEVAAASGNRRLVRLLPTIRLTIQMFHPTLVADRERPWEALSEHAAILDAIRAGDGDRAEQAARLHIRNAKALLVSAAMSSDGRKSSSD